MSYRPRKDDYSSDEDKGSSKATTLHESSDDEKKASKPIVGLNSTDDEKKASKPKPKLVAGRNSTDDSGAGRSGEGEAEGQADHNLLFQLLQNLHLLDDSKKEKAKVLDEVSLEGIIRYIQEGKVKKIITMAGAGISTSAGIPDFRSPGSGLYHNLQKYNLPDPQAIFDIEYFRDNPKPFFVLAKELYPHFIKPTPSHYFIRLLHEKGLLLRHFTQNIDALERVAGTPADVVVEAHGSFLTSHCTECGKEFPKEWMKEHIFSDSIPVCTSCPGVVKPDIVFFGEQLPENFFPRVASDFPKADLLIIMGSSLVVEPFASLVNRVSESCPRLLVNREIAGQRDRRLAMFGLGGGMDFSEDSVRDVAWLGDCDEGCQLLADKLGWGDELRDLVKREHAAMDREKAEAEKAAKKAAKDPPKDPAKDPGSSPATSEKPHDL